jgi:hypothetical protein
MDENTEQRAYELGEMAYADYVYRFTPASGFYVPTWNKLSNEEKRGWAHASLVAYTLKREQYRKSPSIISLAAKIEAREISQADAVAAVQTLLS